MEDRELTQLRIIKRIKEGKIGYCLRNEVSAISTILETHIGFKPDIHNWILDIVLKQNDNCFDGHYRKGFQAIVLKYPVNTYFGTSSLGTIFSLMDILVSNFKYFEDSDNDSRLNRVRMNRILEKRMAIQEARQEEVMDFYEINRTVAYEEIKKQYLLIYRNKELHGESLIKKYADLQERTDKFMSEVWLSFYQEVKLRLFPDNNLQNDKPNDPPNIEAVEEKKEKTFIEYFNPSNPQREQLAESLKNEFEAEKGKSIKLLIESLESKSILILGEREMKNFLKAMEKYFGRKIGTYQSINDFKYNENRHKKDLDSIKIRLEKVIKEHEKQENSL